MPLPADLLAAIQDEIGGSDRALLARASLELTRHYKSADAGVRMVKTGAHRAAYLAVRLPATYAVATAVFSEVRRLSPGATVESILDLGAGPGTALWAAAESFPCLRRATLLEADENWIDVGTRFGKHSPHDVIRQAQWIRQDLRAQVNFPEHDLVVLSYALGELRLPESVALLRQAWSCAGKFLAIIEPGTRRGFGVIHSARSHLIEVRAEILAPCPHRDTCPMAAAGDWCHFSQRVQRTSLHRQLKSGALGYEDEKYSYVVASRAGDAAAPSRIVRHPQKRSGHVQLTLCTRQGLEARTVSRSQGNSYQYARGAEWGDAWTE